MKCFWKWVLICLVIGITASCIPVEDFGEMWNAGTIDGELAGAWKQIGTPVGHDAFIAFVHRGDSFEVQQRTADEPKMKDMETSIPAQLGRTMIVGRHKFLLVNNRARMEKMSDMASTELKEENNDKTSEPLHKAERTTKISDGYIQLYAIEKGRLVFYIVNQERLKAAINSGAVKGEKTDENDPNDHDVAGPSLTKLDQGTLKFLDAFADIPQNWEKKVEYTRVPDLDQALRKANTYPSTQSTVTNATVQVQQPDFQILCEQESEILRRQLQASPDWNVYQEGSDIVAYRVQPVDPQHDTIMGNSANGYESNWEKLEDASLEFDPAKSKTNDLTPSRYQIRYMFRFSYRSGKSQVPEQIDGFSRDFTEAVPMSGETRLALKQDNDGIESYLAVGTNGVWFEFFEQSGKEERIKTREALAWLAEFSREVRSRSKEIAEHGYAAKLIPAGAITAGARRVKIEKPWAQDPGLLSVKAALNPGAQGEVFVKAFDSNTSAALESREIFFETRRFVGWSNNSQKLFPYQGDVHLRGEQGRSAKKLRIEIWFRAGDGKPNPIWNTPSQSEDIKLLAKVIGN